MLRGRRILPVPWTYHLETTNEGCALLERTWPCSWDTCQRTFRGVAVLEHNSEAVYSFTHGDYPWTFFSSARDAVQVADLLAHESAHARLSVVLQFDPLLDDDGAEVHPSPWRPDPRPLAGVMNGVHAFVNVCEFYRRLAGCESSRDSTIFEQQAVKVRTGWRYLKEAAQPTEVGADFLNELEQAVEAL